MANERGDLATLGTTIVVLVIMALAAAVLISRLHQASASPQAAGVGAFGSDAAASGGRTSTTPP